MPHSNLAFAIWLFQQEFSTESNRERATLTDLKNQYILGNTVVQRNFRDMEESVLMSIYHEQYPMWN